MEHEAERFTGCLMFNDDASCERIGSFLEACCGKRIEDIGNLEIAFSTFRTNRLSNRRAFWVIPKLMP
jgi:hypothetical protein